MPTYPMRRCEHCQCYFLPKHKKALYCSDNCRYGAQTELRKKLKQSHDKVHQIGGANIPAMPDRATQEELLNPYYTSVPGNTCVYCGYERECEDHVLPLSTMEIAYVQSIVHKIPMLISERVPCCKTCNSIAGDKAFRSRRDKTRFIQNRRRELNLPIVGVGQVETLQVETSALTHQGEWDKCATCFKLFQAERNGQKFCSKDCLHSYKKDSHA